MKIIVKWFFVGLLFLSLGCQEDKRLTIKIIEVENGYYEWYYYSLITNYSPDRIDFVDENCERTLVYEGRNVMNVDLEKSKIIIECHDCDTVKFNPLEKNQIQIIENDNPYQFQDAIRTKDSLKRSGKKIRCEQ